MTGDEKRTTEPAPAGRAGLSRRSFLKNGSLLVLIAGGPGGLLVACGDAPGGTAGSMAVGQIVPGAVPPTATPAAASAPPASTATPIIPAGAGPIQAVTTTPGAPAANPNDALQVANRFLKLWEAARYDEMYGLLTGQAKGRITQERFVRRYQAITEEATIISVAANASLPPDAATSGGLQLASLDLPFRLDFKTGRVGQFGQENRIPLRFEDGQWKVAWTPSVIFKELSDDSYLVHLFQASSTRGQIIAKNNQPLTGFEQQYEVYVVPGQIENEDQLLATLSKNLGMDPAKIKELYKGGQPDWRMPIKKLPSSTSEALITGLRGLAGVGVDEEAVRNYPQGQSAGHTVGYINKVTAQDLKTLKAKGYTEDDIVGRTGMEAWGEDYLAGGLGGKLTVIDQAGKTVATLSERQVIPSSNLLLTLDMNLQKQTEGILGNRVGSIVVLDATNGAVLALANFPTYDPNLFIKGITQEQFNALNNDPQRPFQHRAVNSQLPVGSTFKVITASAGIARAGFNMQSTFTCTGRWTGLGEANAKGCWLKTGHGKITLFEGLVQSCDVVFYEIGKKLDEMDPNILPDMAKSYGLGSSTGLLGLYDSPGQVPGPQWKQDQLKQGWVRGDAVNLAIGQGYMLASPLQLALVYAAVATGGGVPVPRLVEQAVVPGTNLSPQQFPVKVKSRPNVDDGTLGEIRRALTNVTSVAQGTARQSFVGVKVPVAGKTGTAESGQEAPHAWFACFAPANKPKYVVVVNIEHGGEGSAAAAPLARKVIDILPF